MGAEIDFEKGSFMLAFFVVLGVEFYQEIKGEMYPLKNGSHNQLCIVKVDRVV